MLKSFSVRNYRALRDVKIDLAPLTVLVGPNGVGKSTALEAIHYLTICSQGGDPRTMEQWSLWSPPPTMTGHLFDGEMEVRITGWEKENRRPTIGWFLGGVQLAETVPPRTPNRSPIIRPKSPIPGSPDWPQTFPERVWRLHLDPKVLRNDTQGIAPTGEIGENGQGLAAALNDLKTDDDPRFDFILSAMKQIVPSLRGIKAPRNPKVAGQFTLSCATEASQDIPARHMSDGTLYALALVTTLSTDRNKPTLVLLDDIDQGLHPRAQAELISQIRLIQKRNPKLQVIASCHSPYLVDSLSGDEVVLMEAGNDGFTYVKRLSDHPEYERLKGSLSSGEFWGSVGEAWITGQSKSLVTEP